MKEAAEKLHKMLADGGYLATVGKGFLGLSEETKLTVDDLEQLLTDLEKQLGS